MSSLESSPTLEAAFSCDIFDPNSQYWLNGSEAALARPPRGALLCHSQAALALFHKHAGAALDIQSFETDDSFDHQELSFGSALDIARLAVGTLVVYDTERLVKSKNASEKYPERVVDTGNPVHVLHTINSSSEFFVKDPRARVINKAGEWLPWSMRVITNGEPGRKHFEYVRESGMAMVLPDKQGRRKLFSPEFLSNETNHGQSLGSVYWRGANPPAGLTIGQINLINSRRREKWAVNRLRGLWLYQPSAREFDDAASPPIGQLLQGLAAMAGTSRQS